MATSNHTRISTSLTDVIKSVSLEGSRVASIIQMHRAVISDHLNLKGVSAPTLQINRAKIDGYFNLAYAMLRGVYMNDILIYGGLFMHKSQIRHMAANDSVVYKQFDMREVQIREELDLHRVNVAGSLTMCDGQYFDEVNLTNAKILRSLNICRAGFHQKLYMENIQVLNGVLGSNSEYCDVNLNYAQTSYINFSESKFKSAGDCTESLSLSNSRIAETSSLPQKVATVDAREAKIGGSLLYTNGALINSVDLSGATIGGALRLGNKPEEQTSPRHLALTALLH